MIRSVKCYLCIKKKDKTKPQSSNAITFSRKRPEFGDKVFPINDDSDKKALHSPDINMPQYASKKLLKRHK